MGKAFVVGHFNCLLRDAIFPEELYWLVFFLQSDARVWSNNIPKCTNLVIQVKLRVNVLH